MRSKYSSLLDDPGVMRWHQNVCRGSKITGDVYLRRMGAFAVQNGQTHGGLLKLSAKKRLDLLLDHVSIMESKGYAGSYIGSVVKAVKSWFDFNGIEVRGKIRIRGVQDTPTLADERVPTQDELKKALLSGDNRCRVICILLANCGLRPEVLGNYDGTDGLRVKDLPEMDISNGAVSFRRVPAIVRVRSCLSKKAHEYFSFLGGEGCDYLKTYLEMRMRMGEHLTMDSAIITPKCATKPFIRTLNIGNAARKAIRRAGFPWRPYVLRSYFATQMMLAESKGHIIRDYRQFFMGHKGDIEAVYTLNKRTLPPEVVEQMRECYAKAQKYLQTVPTSEPPEELTRSFRRQLLAVAGFKTDEITDEHLDADSERFQKLVRERLLQGMKPNHAQRVVDVDAVEACLLQGYEFVALLPNNKAVVKMYGAA